MLILNSGKKQGQHRVGGKSWERTQLKKVSENSPNTGQPRINSDCGWSGSVVRKEFQICNSSELQVLAQA